MLRTQAVIEISPTRLEVARLSGRGVAARETLFLEPEVGQTPWPGVLGRVADRLAQLVKDVGVEGAEATVLYTSPDAYVSTFSTEADANPGEAQRRATKAIRDAAPFELPANPSNTALAPTRSGDTKRHAVLLADSADIVEALTSWADQAGMRTQQVAPVRAVLASDRLEDAATRPSDGALIELHVGEHASVLVARSPAGVRFVRVIPMGVEMLVGAMTRPVAAEDGRSVSLTPEQARDYLYTNGVPQPGGASDDFHGVAPRRLLPVIAPVLQRLGVEVKQSVRFGLPDAERDRATISITGPGASIDRLFDLIVEQTGLTAAAVPDAPRLGSDVASSDVGAIAAWARGSRSASLLPATVEQRNAWNATRRYAAGGVAAALCLLAFDAVQTHLDLRVESRRLETVRSQLDLGGDAVELRDRAGAASNQAATVRQHLGASVGSVADLGGLMALLSESAPEGVVLTSVSCSVQGGHAVCRISGEATVRADSVGADPVQSVRAFAGRLGGSAIIERVSLGTIERMKGEYASRFDLTLTVRAIPATKLVELHSTVIASVETGDSP